MSESSTSRTTSHSRSVKVEASIDEDQMAYNDIDYDIHEEEDIVIQPDVLTNEDGYLDEEDDSEIFLVDGVTDEDGAPILPCKNEQDFADRSRIRLKREDRITSTTIEPVMISKSKSQVRKVAKHPAVSISPIRSPTKDSEETIWHGEGVTELRLASGSEGKLKRFACTFCEYRARWKANVENHVKSVHLGIREFKMECPECNYKCKYKSQLSQHVLAIHEKVKPFSCDLCEYSCSQKSSLNLHQREVHQQLRRYCCDLCTFRCGNRYGLKKHLSQRHGCETLFTCYEADCRFVSSNQATFEHHEALHAASLATTSQEDSMVFVGISHKLENSGSYV